MFYVHCYQNVTTCDNIKSQLVLVLSPVNDDDNDDDYQRAAACHQIMAGAAGCWCLGLQCNDLSSLGHQAKLCNIIYDYASVESLQYTSDIIILFFFVSAAPLHLQHGLQVSAYHVSPPIMCTLTVQKCAPLQTFGIVCTIILHHKLRSELMKPRLLVANSTFLY